MKEIILKKLDEIEQEHQVKILFALESGSRGWGFASKDSDYDVRFIYIHKKEHYLRIDKKRDVIEYPIDDVLDVSGWDLPKALNLFYRCNPTLFEWLDSPIVYRNQLDFNARLKQLIPDYFSIKACYHHYLSMLLHNYSDYANKPDIKMKKYFYVLRPVFACLWIMDHGTMPPMEFSQLMVSQSLDAELVGAIEQLLAEKRRGDEQDLRPRIPILDDYISQSTLKLQEYADSIRLVSSKSYDKLNQFFVRVLDESWS